MDYTQMKATKSKPKYYNFPSPDGKSIQSKSKTKYHNFPSPDGKTSSEKSKVRYHNFPSSTNEAAKASKKLKINALVVFVVFAIAILAGFFTCKIITKNDTFEMNCFADSSIDITIGAEGDAETYEELGAKCIAFGKDISSECTIKYYYRSDLTQNQLEVDGVDETQAGIYYAVYTVNTLKYKSVTLIRNIIVLEGEDDVGGVN